MSEFLRETFPWIPAEWVDWVGWALIALGLLLLIVLLWRLAGGARTRALRASQARLAVVEAAEVDQRRRLVLLRRDGVEHLVMIGGPSDIVIERGIGLASSQPARPLQTESPLRRATSQPAIHKPAEARSEPLTPAPPRPVPTASKPTSEAREPATPAIPPRVEIAKPEPPRPHPADSAVRREPAFTRTAGSGVAAKSMGNPDSAIEPAVGRRDVRDTDDLVAEIDDILKKAPRD